MDGLNSFYPSLETGMDHVLSSNQKVAYFQNVDFVNSFKKTHCKVFTYLVIYSSSLKFKKNLNYNILTLHFEFKDNEMYQFSKHLYFFVLFRCHLYGKVPLLSTIEQCI